MAHDAAQAAALAFIANNTNGGVMGDFMIAGSYFYTPRIIKRSGLVGTSHAAAAQLLLLFLLLLLLVVVQGALLDISNDWLLCLPSFADPADRIVAVAAGAQFTYGVTAKGEVVSWVSVITTSL